MYSWYETGFWLQAFCLPIIQTVFETLRDIKEGKASTSITLESASSSGSYPALYCRIVCKIASLVLCAPCMLCRQVLFVLAFVDVSGY